MTRKVLFVDDEPNILEGIQRQLRKLVPVETACGGEEGLHRIREMGPFAVVVSDMRMPNMNGTEFLAKVREACPDTVRMILSGQAELDSTIAAVNEGHIFRFLTKPCTVENLWRSVKDGLEQYRLVLAERELLEKTLSGAVGMLTEILGLTNPLAYRRASRIQSYAESIGEMLGLHNRWQFRLAAMLSQIGCVTLPGDTLSKIYSGQVLSEEEQRLLGAHPEVAGKLLAGIPRLEEVAEMISRQARLPDTSSLSTDIRQWEPTVLGAEIIRAAVELDNLLAQGIGLAGAIESLSQSSFDEVILDAMQSVRIVKSRTTTQLVKVSELEIGMIVDEDIVSSNGIRLVPAGHEVTKTILIRLRSSIKGIGVAEPFRVCVAA